MEKWVIIIVIAILTAFAAQKAQAQPHPGQTAAQSKAHTMVLTEEVRTGIHSAYRKATTPESILPRAGAK